MGDFDNLGNIPPEEFQRMMNIKDIDKREQAIRSWESQKQLQDMMPKPSSPDNWTEALNESQMDFRAISKMASDIKIDWNKFEPTDSQGTEMSGVVTYQDKDYPVEVRTLSNDSYEMQVATQIYNSMMESRAVKFASVDTDLGIDNMQSSNEGLENDF